MPEGHNKLINTVARKVLKPMGLRRKGNSRTWFDDHGWWVIQVEFQPSAWTKGSYLNVGVCWLLYESGHVSFDVGYRVDVPFVEFTGQDQFESQILAIAARAGQEVEKYRTKFSTLERAAEFHRSLARPTTWDQYHGGIILRLADQCDAARDYLAAVAAHRTRCDWERALAARAADLLRLLDDSDAFRSSVLGIVRRTRRLVSLDDWAFDDASPFGSARGTA